MIKNTRNGLKIITSRNRMKVWVARNKNGNLNLFTSKPVRWKYSSSEENIWFSKFGFNNQDGSAYGMPVYDFIQFNKLGWEDEPWEFDLKND